MTAILLAVLLLQERSLDASVEAFLKGDETARAELLKAGAPAIRPLLRVRDRSPEPVQSLLREIKVRVAWPRALDLPEKLKNTWGVVMSLDRLTDFNMSSKMLHEQGIPLFSDFFDNARLITNRVQIMKAKSALDFVELLCIQSGLDYGIFHGTFVVGVPERLWPEGPARKALVLDEAARARAAEWIEKLADDSIEVRESAARGLAGLGTGIIPLLEAQLKRPEKEIAARCESIISGLRKPREAAFGPPGVMAQTLPEKDRAWLQELQGIQPGGSYLNVPLSQLAADMKKTYAVTMSMPDPIARTRVSIFAGDRTLVEILSLVTQSRDLDFVIRDRTILIDTHDALEGFRK